jgi:hypothetical protein
MRSHDIWQEQTIPVLQGCVSRRWQTPHEVHRRLCLFRVDFGALRDSVKFPTRGNGLRHGFVSFHFALIANENLAAAEAWHSPGMVHRPTVVASRKCDCDACSLRQSGAMTNKLTRVT